VFRDKWILRYTVHSRSGESCEHSIFQLRNQEDCSRRLVLEKRRWNNIERYISAAAAIAPDGVEYKLDTCGFDLDVDSPEPTEEVIEYAHKLESEAR